MKLHTAVIELHTARLRQSSACNIRWHPNFNHPSNTCAMITSFYGPKGKCLIKCVRNCPAPSPSLLSTCILCTYMPPPPLADYWCFPRMHQEKNMPYYNCTFVIPAPATEALHLCPMYIKRTASFHYTTTQTFCNIQHCDDYI